LLKELREVIIVGEEIVEGIIVVRELREGIIVDEGIKGRNNSC
jgi:hypothetical protein